MTTDQAKLNTAGIAITSCIVAGLSFFVLWFLPLRRIEVYIDISTGRCEERSFIHTRQINSQTQVLGLASMYREHIGVFPNPEWKHIDTFPANIFGEFIPCDCKANSGRATKQQLVFRDNRPLDDILSNCPCETSKAIVSDLVLLLRSFGLHFEPDGWCEEMSYYLMAARYYIGTTELKWLECQNYGEELLPEMLPEPITSVKQAQDDNLAQKLNELRDRKRELLLHTAAN